jgi:hypothetical protein
LLYEYFSSKLDRKKTTGNSIRATDNFFISTLIRMDVCRRIGSWNISWVRVLERIYRTCILYLLASYSTLLIIRHEKNFDSWYLLKISQK